MAGLRSSKKSENLLESAPRCIIDIIQPTLNALAKVGMTNGTDNGQDTRVDSSIKFILGSTLRMLHDQVYGQIMFRDRNGIPQSMKNAKARYDDSDQAFRKLVQKHSGDDEALVSDPEYHRITEWLSVNDARFTSYRQLIDVFSEVYTHVTGVAFEYTPRQQSTMTQAVLSAAEKATRLKNLEAYKARIAA